MWSAKFASVWDLLKRVLLGAVLGLVTLIVVAPVLDVVFARLLPPIPSDAPPGVLIAAASAMPLCGAIIAVVGRNWFGRKTRAAVLGVLIGGIVAGIATVLCGGQGETSQKGRMVMRQRLAEKTVPAGLLVGGLAGYLYAVASTRRRGRNSTMSGEAELV
jgi:hypothetical protein